MGRSNDVLGIHLEILCLKLQQGMCSGVYCSAVCMCSAMWSALLAIAPKQKPSGWLKEDKLNTAWCPQALEYWAALTNEDAVKSCTVTRISESHLDGVEQRRPDAKAHTHCDSICRQA